MANGFPYLAINSDIRELMVELSTCRDERCRVPQRHPFYPVPDQPPFFYGKRPCMPVVPTYLATGKVMVIGQYPNCRFATVPPVDSGRKEKFLPVADINEPFEGGRYFDGFSVRAYPTEDCLVRLYLDPLGLDLASDIWLTNINKCYLMKDSNIRDYADVGWDTPAAQVSFRNDNDYFAIAAVCMECYLARELALCQPKLVIALGERAYRMAHSSDDLTQAAPDIRFTDIVGVLLRAGEQTHALDRRNRLFRDLNVIHLSHPSYFARPHDPADEARHLENIAQVKILLGDLGL